jgi:DNA-binding protein HU-beta
MLWESRKKLAAGFFLRYDAARRHTPMPNMMTKTQIETYLAEKLKITKSAAGTFLDEFAALATRETKKSGMFVWPGIGKLVKVMRKARMGRNPRNGETIKIPAKTVVKFRVAKAVKDSVMPAPKKAAA